VGESRSTAGSRGSRVSTQACRAPLARDDYDREGKPEICWASADERTALVNDLFADACRVIIARAGIADPRLVAEVKLLATVAAQDVEDDGAARCGLLPGSLQTG
jgi:hypothetical protein